MFDVFYLFNARHLLAPALTRPGLLGNRYACYATAALFGVQLAFTYLGPMQSLFHTTPIDLAQWVRILAVASSVLILVDLEQTLPRRHSKGWREPRA